MCQRSENPSEGCAGTAEMRPRFRRPQPAQRATSRDMGKGRWGVPVLQGAGGAGRRCEMPRQCSLSALMPQEGAVKVDLADAP